MKDDGGAIALVSLGRLLEVRYPGGEVTFGGGADRPIWQWRLVTLNYLSRADGAQLTGELVAYRQLDGGRAYEHAFAGRTVHRLASLVDEHQPEVLRAALQQLDGRPAEFGDIAAVLHFMPRFPMTVSLWMGDEEMPSSASIVFDGSANRYLHTEDAAVAAGITVDCLCRAAKHKAHKNEGL